VGLAFSILRLILGMENLSYATSAAAIVAIILLDYIIAYVFIGFAGFLRGKVKDHGMALAMGTLLVCAARYTCHVISGCTVWAGVSVPTTDGLIFSLAYNAAYMVPETLLTVVGAYFAGKAFTLTEAQVKRVPMEKGSLASFYSAIPAAIGAVISFVLLFSMMQTKAGFDITALTDAGVYQWITVAAVLGVGVIATVIIRFALKQRTAE
jgi:thiamine transporter